MPSSFPDFTGLPGNSIGQRAEAVPQDSERINLAAELRAPPAARIVTPDAVHQL